MKYKIICPCPEIAITSWQLFVSMRPQTVLTRDVKEESAVENCFQRQHAANAHEEVLQKLGNARAQFPAKSPAGSPSNPCPSLLCLFEVFVGIKLPKMFLGLSGWDAMSTQTSHLSHGPTIPGNPMSHTSLCFCPPDAVGPVSQTSSATLVALARRDAFRSV